MRIQSIKFPRAVPGADCQQVPLTSLLLGACVSVSDTQTNNWDVKQLGCACRAVRLLIDFHFTPALKNTLKSFSIFYPVFYKTYIAWLLPLD